MRSPHALTIGDFGLPSDNLMIHFALACYAALDAPADERWRDLASFKMALDSVSWHALL